MRSSSHIFLTRPAADSPSAASTSTLRNLPARMDLTSSKPDLWTRSRSMVSPSGSLAPALFEITTLTVKRRLLVVVYDNPS